MAFGVAAVVAGVGLYGANKAASTAKSAMKASERAANLQYDIAEREVGLAEKAYADQKGMLDQLMPLFQQQVQTSIAEQAKSTQRGDVQWQTYERDFMPVEQQLAQKSLAFDTPGRREQAANEAGGQAAEQFGIQRDATREALIRSGQDASTIAALDASAGLEAAKGITSARNTARRDVESKGMAYLDNAARFGRNMPSTGIATAGLATNQGAAAQQAGAFGLNAAATPATTAAGLYGQAANAAGGSAASINAGARTALYGQDQANQIFGDVLGAGLKAYGMFGSSKKTKHVGKKVEGAAEAVSASPASQWSYKQGLGDGNVKLRMGPMAEDLAKVAPEVSDGKMVDMVSMVGLHHAAIGENTQRLQRIEKALGLADAKGA